MIMKKVSKRKFINRINVAIATVIFVLISGCADPSIEMQKSLSAKAKTINEGFIKVKVNAIRVADLVSNKSSGFNQNAIDLSVLESERTGGYKLFNKFMYINAKNNDNVFVCTYSGKSKYTEGNTSYLFGKKICAYFWKEIMNEFLPIVKDKAEYVTGNSIFLQDIFNGSGDFYVCSSPWQDFASLIPPGIPDIHIFDWFNIITPEKDPDRSPRWTPEPFVSIGAQGEGGWIQTVSVPIYLKDGRFFGDSTSDMLIIPFTKVYFDNEKKAMLMLSHNMLPISLTKAAEDIIGVKGIVDYYYLNQLIKNPKAADNAYFTHVSQPEDIKELAGKISGNSKFEQKVKGKTYIFIVEKIPEVNSYLLGIVNK